jgi:hypothetical protein
MTKVRGGGNVLTNAIKTSPKMFNLQKHFDQNQLLKDALKQEL